VKRAPSELIPPFFCFFPQDAETRPAQLGGGGCAYAPCKHSWLIASEPVPDTLQPLQVGSLHSSRVHPVHAPRHRQPSPLLPAPSPVPRLFGLAERGAFPRASVENVRAAAREPVITC